MKPQIVTWLSSVTATNNPSSSPTATSQTVASKDNRNKINPVLYHVERLYKDGHNDDGKSDKESGKGNKSLNEHEKALRELAAVEALTKAWRKEKRETVAKQIEQLHLGYRIAAVEDVDEDEGE